MRQSILTVSLCASIMGSGLSGCASLKKSWAGFGAKSVTMPDDMSKDAYLSDQPSLVCLLYTSPSPRDKRQSRMPSSA